MTFSSGVRRLVLSLHLAVSVGWVGAVAAYIALDVVAATSEDVQNLRAAYLGMDLIARSVIVPLAIAALLTGIAISVGTKWGLLRYWWVVISLLLTLLATVVLLVETRVIGRLAAVAADPTVSTDELRAVGNTLLHSVGGTAILIVILVLNVYKPQGMTPYGWRKRRAQREASEGRLRD